MSDFHILTCSNRDHEIECVFHLPVPGTGSNVAGTQWRTCLAEWRSGNTTSVVPSLAAAEQTKLDDGELLEKRETVRVDANLTNTEKVNIIKARYTYHKDNEHGAISLLQSTLKYWGHSGDVA